MVEPPRAGDQCERMFSPIPQFNDLVCRLAGALGMKHRGQGYSPILANHACPEARRQAFAWDGRKAL
jgi:hypothetical protein